MLCNNCYNAQEISIVTLLKHNNICILHLELVFKFISEEVS